MKYIKTEKAPRAIGPYSQAVLLENRTLFISGQLGLDPKTMQLKENIHDQTVQSLKNIKSILSEAGYKKNNVAKVTILLKDINDFSVVNEIYSSFFEEHKPARSTFAVKELPKNGLVEIEAIAFK
ncbi:RidA family protein [Spiroplasma endosymbiont of Atherix ibis]|uniref:RidA family protein n=1 Tax=Spiroplasma endosymbiont of Atherix ibis TaxID=3066291 RepID=UPI0030CB46E3